jgi:aspartyl-tRNA(Asn)/glutamyl-tRNA(Gln) amidotransferase subunit C
MVDRSDVLHVARLARLRLTDDETEAMASELSSILGHVDQIAQLDLEGIEPTTHVVELVNVARADTPREGLDRERALEAAPDPSDEMFRAPSPQA